MTLHILSVAYPFAPTGPDAVGGAEQVLSHLDRALVRSGHESIVIACEGSQAAGRLVTVPRADEVVTESVRSRIYTAVRQRIEEVLATDSIDVVHMHGIDFFEYLPAPGVPVLVTLHLPPSWYPKEVFRLNRPDIHLHCVSAAQERACPPGSQLLPAVENGLSSQWFSPHAHARRNFALALGRICPEKGFHLALDAARQAGSPMLLAGEVFAYPAHQEYFQAQIIPRLDQSRRFIGPVGLARKRRLLAGARCLLVPSLVAETSSLVAMEALASGTPVIAFASGALPEIVEHGKTGLVVQDEREMAAAISRVSSLRAEDCCASARQRFSGKQMFDGYLGHYRRLTNSERDRRLQADHTGSAGDSAQRVASCVRPAQEHSSSAHRITMVELSRPGELEDLREEWVNLWQQCPSATPFQSPAWLLSWWRQFGSNELCVFAAYTAGRLVGLLPCCRHSAERRLELVGAGVSDYLGMVAAPEFEAEVVQALWRHLLSEPHRWERSEFQPLRSSSPLLTPPGAAADRWHRNELDACPILNLPNRVEDLGLSVPARQLENCRYYWRRAQSRGQIEIQTATADTLRAELDVFFQLHSARWTERGGPGVLADDSVQRFHRECAPELLALGALRLSVLRIHGCPAAALYGFQQNRTFFYYLGGFDPQFRQISPGTLLIHDALKRAVAEGATQFDFLRGRESYKYLWGAKDTLTYRVELAKAPSPPS